jgi:hypothetical protein
MVYFSICLNLCAIFDDLTKKQINNLDNEYYY